MKKFLTAIIVALLLFCFTAQATLSVIDEAMTHLGKPYVWDTEGPKTFDCSGFTYYCFKTTLDIELPRTAKAQGYNTEYQKITSIDLLKEGDLVFFNTVRDKDLCDHVGIYLGDGEFIHCSSSRKNKGVVISTLLEGFYNKRFSWGGE